MTERRPLGPPDFSAPTAAVPVGDRQNLSPIDQAIFQSPPGGASEPAAPEPRPRTGGPLFSDTTR
ncbi:hypothetical protein [Streptacidiphilus sp. PAMC 29251]